MINADVHGWILGCLGPSCGCDACPMGEVEEGIPTGWPVALGPQLEAVEDKGLVPRRGEACVVDVASWVRICIGRVKRMVGEGCVPWPGRIADCRSLFPRRQCREMDMG